MDPQRTGGPELLRQGSRLLARAHGPRHAGHVADPINNAFSAASYQPAYDGQSQWNHVFSPNATNQFIVAGSYYRAIFTQNDPGLFPYAVTGNGFNLTQVGGTVFNFPQGRNTTQYQIVDDFSLTKGAHNLKFGVNYRRYDITDYTFSVLNDPLVFISSPLDLYNGNAVQYRQRFPSRATQPVALWGMGIYGQDEWRVNKSLKLTLALRAEHNSNPVCQTDCAALLDASFNTLLADGQLTPTTPYNSIIDANRHQVFRSTDADQHLAALRICLVAGRQRQDGRSRRLWYLL